MGLKRAKDWKFRPRRVPGSPNRLNFPSARLRLGPEPLPYVVPQPPAVAYPIRQAGPGFLCICRAQRGLHPRRPGSPALIPSAPGHRVPGQGALKRWYFSRTPFGGVPRHAREISSLVFPSRTLLVFSSPHRKTAAGWPPAPFFGQLLPPAQVNNLCLNTSQAGRYACLQAKLVNACRARA